MVITKGAELEELVRTYLSKQGFFTLRAVPFKYEGFDVTDLDVWLYSRHAASARVRGIVDVKNKKSPKAFERVLWVKGLQAVLQCDRAIIATTDSNPALAKFAQSQKISVISKSFLDRLEKNLDAENRLTFEEFTELVQRYEAQKQDGDWLRILADAKSAVASLNGFQSFNKTMFAFHFFASRAEVRTQHREEALRCALLCAALACIALDSALEQFLYNGSEKRFEGIMDGVTYGNEGAKISIENALSVLSESMQNGKSIAAKAREQFNKRILDVRADIIAEYFMREHNVQHLFPAAKELDDAAHLKGSISSWSLSLEARSILGVFADFVGVTRSALPISGTPHNYMQAATISAQKIANTSEAQKDENITSPQKKLL